MKKILIFAVALFACCSAPTGPAVNPASGQWRHYATDKNIYLRLYAGDSMQIIRQDIDGGNVVATSFFRGTYSEQVSYLNSFWDTPLDTMHDLYAPVVAGDSLFLSVEFETNGEKITIPFTKE